MTQDNRSSISREQIIEIAIQEFGVNGYKQASTNCICKDSKISKGLIFYHFKSKKELFYECAKYCMQEFDAFMKENFDLGASLLEGIQNCCLRRKDFFTEHPNHHRIFSEVLYEKVCDMEEENYLELLESYKKHSYDVISRILCDAPFNPKISRDEGIQCALTIIEHIDREVWNQKFSEESRMQKLEEQMRKYEVLLEMLLYGILDSCLQKEKKEYK